MATIIKSTIKTTPVGRWYIELKDTSKPYIKEECLSVEEYAQKLEEIAAMHGNNIEVVWKSDKDVTPIQIHEVRMEMNAYEAKMAAEDEN